MRLMILLLVFLAGSPRFVIADKPETLATGLQSPESVAVDTDGNIYVSIIGGFGTDGDGSIVKISNREAEPFAQGLNDPKGIAIHQKHLYVTDKNRILKINSQGETTEFVPADTFPRPPMFLNDIVADPETGTLYVSDSGNMQGEGGVIYQVNPRGKVSLIADSEKIAGLHSPNGLVMDGKSHLLMVDYGTGTLYRIKLSNGSATKLADGFGGADGLAWDHYGRLFISDWSGGRVFVIARPGAKPVLMTKAFQSAADICFDPANNRILVPDMRAGTLSAAPIVTPGHEVDETPFALKTEVAFPNIEWADWTSEDDSGLVVPIRPIVLTHAGDNSNRVFMATQRGVIHVFENDQNAKKSKVFLDIQDRVKYDDRTNEEGFLGLAFHPKFKENGEFFVFYTTKHEELVNIVSRFRLTGDDPNRADAKSEEEIIRFKKPFWNHDGGTICFGPDGYLYITHGDGGLANDPYKNGQKLSTLLGKVLRIDVNKKADGKNYAVPSDNPFVGRSGVLPEIWAYGLRNIWRMAFDTKTGNLWAGDVGQNLYEEIILISRGGNYGWNLRESYHPFGREGAGLRDDLIEPIWEYHHDVGKSITGGHVYRGSRFPELDGHYLYADYVSGKIWALRYDESKDRVVANRPIEDKSLPILSFGEDNKGDAYLLTTSPTGRGIYRLARSKKSSSVSSGKLVALFDGESLDGWEGDKKVWRVENGCIVGGSLEKGLRHNDFLATKAAHDDFVLRLKFKLLGDPKKGFVNSGIQIRSKRVPNSPEMSGYQCDIGDPEWWGCIYDESRRNQVLAKSDMSRLNMALKRNDWNEYEIRAQGKRIRTYINGVLGVDYTEPDDAIPQTGHIAIQVHSGAPMEIWVKDITIESMK